MERWTVLVDLECYSWSDFETVVRLVDVSASCSAPRMARGLGFQTAIGFGQSTALDLGCRMERWTVLDLECYSSKWLDLATVVRLVDVWA